MFFWPLLTHLLLFGFAATGCANPVDLTLDEIDGGASRTSNEQVDSTKDVIPLERFSGDYLARRNEDWCLRISTASNFITASCAVVGSVAAIWHLRSKEKKCINNEVYYYGEKPKATWVRTSTHGGDCATTAHEDTMRGAISAVIEEAKKRKAGFLCARFSHGGTWYAELVVSTKEDEARHRDCSASDTFLLCSSTGNGHKCSL